MTCAEGPTTLPAFDGNHFPLEPGIRLLEASAGTGKTFALAQLVLRLVAEEGLSLRQLLVVTFTDAAAAELRDRIGRRLQEALSALEQPGREPGDQVLRDWLAGQRGTTTPGESGPAEELLRGRLLLALEDLDGADITTIHGFCQRSLRRQAIEAHRAPELQLESDGAALVSQVVHDYWQQQVLPLPASLVAGLARKGMTPPELEHLLQRLDGDPALALDPLPADVPPGLSLAALLPEFRVTCWHTFLQEWQKRGRELEADFRDAATAWRSAGVAKTGDYTPKPRSNRCDALDTWLNGLQEIPDYETVLGQNLLTDYFHPGTFCKEARRAEGDERPIRLPQEPLMRAVAALVDGPAELALLHACHWGRAELRRRRERSGTVGFSQLLEALDPGPHASAPTALLQAVGERYRVALIDEFQDTDPIQWRILRLAFAQATHQMVMVGDPKQAIYRFRGGDLATYLQARQQASGRFGLIENRRATAELVETLNDLMGPAGLTRSALAVPAVKPRADRSGPASAPVELLWLGEERAAGEKPPSKSSLEGRLPGQIASHTADLLGRGLTLREKGTERPLRPDDICLLVGTHRQAEQLRAALQRQGIASRLVSRADVFASPAATALQRFLDALADPADGNRLRLLAASPLLGWSAAEIAAAEPSRWSELAGELERLAGRLPRQGLLGALADLLGSRALARIFRSGRLLADLQQVSELVLAKIHADQLGPAAAADWLRRLRLDEGRQELGIPEEHQAHSDRVDGVVSVVTVHASKGLEYPVVICPYLWQAAGSQRSGSPRPGVRWHPPGRQEPVLALHLDRRWGTGRQAHVQHLAAEQAEGERLAYVAATRAQHLLVLAWGPAQGQQGNPLFPWLFPAEPLPTPEHDPIGERSDADWRSLLEAEIERRRLPLRLVDPPAAESFDRSPEPPLPRPLATGPVPGRRLDASWGRSSYTSWTRVVHGTLAPTSLEEGRDTADPSPPDLAPDPGEAIGPAALPGESWPAQGPLAAFPRGAAAGDCLHRILEQLDYRRPAADPPNREAVERELRRAALQEQPLEPLLEGLEQLRLTPFGGALGGLRVGDLDRVQRLNEMNFDLTLGFARAAALAAAFTDHPGGRFGAAYARRLAALPVASRGFLTGSIDLVFTAPDPGGVERWWVADWKSNWLGERGDDGRPLACGPRHYGAEAMAELMAANHYPLQAHLYLVALHRYLRWRLPGYEPERHLGGYVYVFLRGTPGSAGERALPGAVPGMVVETPPPARLLALDAALGGLPAEGERTPELAR